MPKCLQINIRCYATSKRLLESYVDKHRIDVIFLSETWHKESNIKFKNWTTTNIVKNRTGGYGGVAILAKPQVKIVARPDYDTEDIEICWAQLYIHNKIITVASVYIPPGDTEALTKLFTNLKKITNLTKGPIIIAGDLNARSRIWEKWHIEYDVNWGASWKHGKIVEENVLEFNLDILNDGSPTRDFNHQISSPDITLAYRLHDSHLKWRIQNDIPVNSDHLPIVFELPEGTDDNIRRVWDFDKTNWDAWSATIKNGFQDWPQPDLQTGEQLCDNFTEKFNNLAESIETKVLSKHSKPFFNEDLRKLLSECKKRKHLYKRRRDPHNYLKLTEAVNTFISAYNNARDEYWTNKCEQLRTSETKSWAVVNKVLGSNISAPVQPLIRPDKDYDFDDVKIAHRLEAVHILRSHVNKSDFNDEWASTVEQHVQHVIKNNSHDDNEAYNCDITREETFNVLRSLKDKTCPGPDKIHPIPLYQVSDIIYRPLHILFQHCWNEGKIPSIWKSENRIYIPKPGKPNYNIEKSYRSLSLSSCVGKLYEKIICRRLVATLHERNLFDQEQYAYIQGRDLCMALINFTLDIHDAFKKGKHTGSIMIDFEGAFDAVWRKGVIYKIIKLGIRGRMLDYIHDFLQNRFSRSLVNSVTTPWISTDVGIPQGSILGPILYIIFTVDIQEYIDLPVIKFADDITMWYTGDNISDTEDTLSTNMNRLLMWAYN